MSFRQKLKQIFSSRQTSSPETLEPPTSAPVQPTNHSSTSFPTFAIKKTKTNATTKTTKEAQKREKREKKEQKKRDKRKNSKPKIELYKPYEIPPSKYRGPRDEAHQQRLNAYTFNSAGSSTRVAQANSPELSPRATIFVPARSGSDVSEKIGPLPMVDMVEDVASPPNPRFHPHHPLGHEHGYDESGSEPTTMVDTDGDSPSRSRLTVQTERTVVDVDVDAVDDIKNPPASISPTTPFSPEQLAEALNTTRLHS